MTEPSLGEVVSAILLQPQSTVVVAIQFLLGLVLGYISVKVLKYILAFIAILALGTFLSIWSLGTTPTEVLQTLKVTAGAVKNLAIVLGLMTVGPISIGFIVGVVVGLIKR